MRKIVLSIAISALFILLSFSPLISNAEVNDPAKDLSTSKVEIENAKLITSEKLKAEKVAEKKENFDAMLQEHGISEDEVEEEGDFYYDSSRDQFVLQIKKDIKNASNKEKFNRFKEKVAIASANATTIVNDVLIKEVKRSRKELIEVQDEFFKINNAEQFSHNTTLVLDTENNRLELLTDAISENLKKELEKTYEDKLYIKTDPDYVDAQKLLKARKANWNQLGAGIGLNNNYFEGCTTAGIAYNASQHFILTAGHCIGSGGTVAYQWGVPVGTAHLNSMASGFDFGLVRIDRPNGLNGGRYATNGYYIDGSNPSGYDAKVSGVAKPYFGMPVCKSGIKTGYTCGEVMHIRTIHPITRLVGIRVESSNPRFASAGDSGSALTYYNGGIHRTIGILSAGATTAEYQTTVYFTPIVEVLEKYGLSFYSSNTSRRL